MQSTTSIIIHLHVLYSPGSLFYDDKPKWTAAAAVYAIANPGTRYFTQWWCNSTGPLNRWFAIITDPSGEIMLLWYCAINMHEFFNISGSNLVGWKIGSGESVTDVRL